jgi:hypothetical protein
MTVKLASIRTFGPSPAVPSQYHRQAALTMSRQAFYDAKRSRNASPVRMQSAGVAQALAVLAGRLFL